MFDLQKELMDEVFTYHGIELTEVTTGDRTDPESYLDALYRLRFRETLYDRWI